MKKFKLGKLQREWINTLRKHPERQLREALGELNKDGSYKCCCLGQAKIIIETSKGNNYRSCFNESARLEDRGGQYHLLNSFDDIGLINEVGDSKRGGGYSLSELNDIGYSWGEIADILEADPELYFNRSV